MDIPPNGARNIWCDATSSFGNSSNTDQNINSNFERSQPLVAKTSSSSRNYSWIVLRSKFRITRPTPRMAAKEQKPRVKTAKSNSSAKYRRRENKIATTNLFQYHMYTSFNVIYLYIYILGWKKFTPLFSSVKRSRFKFHSGSICEFLT